MFPLNIIISPAISSIVAGTVLYFFISSPFIQVFFNVITKEVIMGNRILLHVCCGPCSTASIERLLGEGYEPVLFFSDSNIYPEAEFEKRYDNLLKVAAFYNLEVIKDAWLHESWLEWIKGYENEREHGKRCTLCFRYNLMKAAEKAEELGIPYFATTLTVSRFKNSKVIFSQGEDLKGFLAIDFKKKDGFNRSIVLSKELGLYRQQYCGCEFSMRDAVAD